MAVFFWKRATAAGAVASIVLGTVVTVAWNITGEHAVDAVYPALAISLIALIGISLMGRPPEQSKWKPFFES
jgi:SSS family solute:Na+ symporter/sodium/proline symporter